MKVKTSDLIGPTLDWAVARCEGKDNAWVLYCVKRGGLQYSTDWAHGGPIIEREGIEINLGSPDKWVASIGGEREIETGPTPLIAAMRCYVASCLGDEVDIPVEIQ